MSTTATRGGAQTAAPGQRQGRGQRQSRGHRQGRGQNQGQGRDHNQRQGRGQGNGRALGLTAVAVLLAVAAELPLLRVFGSPGLRVVLLAAPVACVAAVVVRTLVNRVLGTADVWRDSSPAAVGAGFLVGLVGGAVPGMVTAAADPFGPSALLPRLEQAVTDGWYRLLSVPVPVPLTRSFTDLPFLLAAALAALIGLCALSRYPGVALVPAVAGFGGLLVLGADGPVTGTLLTGGFALAAVSFLAVAAPPTPGAIRSRGVTGMLSGGGLIAAAVLFVGVLHPAAPYNPRAKVQLPVDIQVTQDPIALLSSLLQTPTLPVLTARLSDALLAAPRNWVLLAYDDYTGAGWQAPGEARPAVAASAVPSAIGTGTATVVIAAPITLLPHPAAVLSSSPADLDYAPDLELLAAPAPVRQYTVRVSVGVPSAAAVGAAAVPSGMPAALTAVPSCVPPALSALAATIRTEASLPGEQVERLQAYFTAAPFAYDKAAAPGEGCASINSMLAARKGTSAQFATAFVLTARLLGIPARVAVGYTPGTLAGGVATVTDADAYAWTQVDLTGIGWMDVDPTPKSTAKGHDPDREKQPALTQIRKTPPKTGRAGSGSPIAVPPPAGGLGTAAAVAAGIGGLAVLVAAWLAVVWAYGATRRSRRRRAADPAARLLGAWHEALVPLGQAGVRVSGQSAPAVAAHAAATVPAARRQVRDLASLAERALYDRVGDADAAAAWQLSDQARQSALAAADWRKRLRRLLLPSR
jgi:transglutaminase-like putative cysteine protease